MSCSGDVYIKCTEGLKKKFSRSDITACISPIIEIHKTYK